MLWETPVEHEPWPLAPPWRNWRRP
ncbi:hypothetical protein ACFQ3Z_34570 [Streptomyces nogalater]